MSICCFDNPHYAVIMARCDRQNVVSISDSFIFIFYMHAYRPICYPSTREWRVKEIESSDLRVG